MDIENSVDREAEQQENEQRENKQRDITAGGRRVAFASVTGVTE